MKRALALLALAALIAAGLIAWVSGSRRQTADGKSVERSALSVESSKAQAQASTLNAQGSTLLESVEVSGTIEGTRVRIAAKLAGRVAAVRVREGDSVHKGEELITLEGREVNAQRDQARAQLATARARYDEALAGTRPESIRQAEAELRRANAARDGAAAAVRNLQEQWARSTELKEGFEAAQSQASAARATLAAAQARRDHLKAGARPDEVHEAEEAVTGAEATAQRAVEEEDRMRRAFERGAVARREWDLARTERDVTAASLARARAHLADLKAGARAEELQEAEQQVAAASAASAGARSALANARRLYQDRLPARQRLDAARAELRTTTAAAAAAQAQLDLLRRGARPEVVRQLRAQLHEAQAALQLADAHERDLRIDAPVAGVVTERGVEPGEVVQPGARLLEVADLHTVWVRVYLPEQEYGHVHAGDRVPVACDSLPDRTLVGRVEWIGQEAEYTPRNVETKEERSSRMYAVKVAIENPQGALRIGMPVDVRFR